jgi:hypothetical protein
VSVGVIFVVVVGEVRIIRVAVCDGFKPGLLEGVAGAGVELGGNVRGAVVTDTWGTCSPIVQACRKMMLIHPARPMKRRLHLRMGVEFSAMISDKRQIIAGKLKFPKVPLNAILQNI